jgi:spectinomycin phosphotransferase
LYGRPPVTVRAIRRTLRDAYAIEPASVSVVPYGHDAHAWVYRVDATDGTAWLAKLHESPPTLASILVPQHVAGLGLAEVVAPVPTLSGSRWATIESEPDGAVGGPPVLVVAPFVEGTLALSVVLDDAQWRAYGGFLGALHATRIPSTLERLLPRETFTPYNVAEVHTLVATRPVPSRGPARAVVSAFWRDHAARIERLLTRCDELARRLAADPPPNVLCHADIHRGNILVEPAGGLRFIDWDGVVYAPRERDLMFVIDGVTGGPRVTARQQHLFLEGYGPVEINRVALAYHRHAWAIQDIGEYTAQVLRRGRVARAEREEALARLVGQFDPDGQVAAAEADWDSIERPGRPRSR